MIYTERIISRFNEKDQQKMKEFLNQLFVENLSHKRIMKYFSNLSSIYKLNQKPFVEYDKDTLFDTLIKIHQSQYKPNTKKDFKIILRKFLNFLGKSDITKYIKIKEKINEKVLPEHVLSEKEIEELIKAASTIRDKAIISLLYESAARISEFLGIKLKDITFDQYGALLRLRGKTGERVVRLVMCVPLLQKWINDYHPDKLNPDSYLWVKEKTYPSKPLGYVTIKKILKENIEKTNIKKRIYPHLLRHSRLTILAKRLSDSQLKLFAGWTQSSKMNSVYIHLSSKDCDNAILSLYGIQENNTEKPIDFVTCMKCYHKNPIGNMFCDNCKAVLDDKMSKLEDVLIEFFEFLKVKYPELKDILKQIAKKHELIK